VIERARAFACELEGESCDAAASCAAGGAGEQAVVVQFELAAGSYATSFLFEMCAGASQ
jgi:tRNA(Glu) U13 pseudouridine synthase TruD